MAPAPSRLKVLTVTCTSFLLACSGIHSVLTQTNWFSARSWNTTVCLQVWIFVCVSSFCFDVSEWSEEVLCFLPPPRKQSPRQLQESNGHGCRQPHLVRHGAGVHTVWDGWTSIQLAQKWLSRTPRWVNRPPLRGKWKETLWMRVNNITDR